MTSEAQLPAADWPAHDVRLQGWTLSVRTAPLEPVPGLEPAVMVHGLGGSSLNWTDVMALLADRLESRAVDLPGFGFSPPPDSGDYTIAGHAKAVAALIEHDGRGPVHLFGNSLGGAVCVRLAAARPDLVQTLTLISPALPDFRPGRWRSQVALLSLPVLGPLVSRRLADMTPAQRVKGLVDLVYADPTVVPQDRLERAALEVERRAALPYAVEAMAASTRGLINTFFASGSGAPWSQAARVTAPTLLMYGRQDKLVPAQVARKAKAAFPDATVVVLPRTGHVAQLEHPRLVEHLVRRHLARSDHGAGSGSTLRP